MSFSRRELLRALGAAGVVSVGLGLKGRAAQAINLSPMNYKVLEIFLGGGMHHELTLWAHDDRIDQHLGVSFSGIHWARIQGSSTPPTSTWALGDGVNLGPSFSALDPSLRSYVLARTRVVALGHDLAPHEPAGALTVNGRTIARPERAGLGAEIAAARGCHPCAAVFDPNGGHEVGQYASTGLLGNAHRPIVIPLLGYQQDEFIANLQRDTQVAALDDLWKQYQDDYEDRLYFAANGERARARDLDAYDSAARDIREEADTIRSWMDHITPDITQTTINTAGKCNSPPGFVYAQQRNRTYQGIVLAARLLAAGEIRYASVLDVGMEWTYDTHGVTPCNGMSVVQEHATVQVGNLWNVFRALSKAIMDGDLDLSKTMIVLNTEFGRWFATEGSEHWTPGYAVALIGGPIGLRDSMGQLIGGAPGTAGKLEFYNNSSRGGVALRADDNPGYHPTDFRAAVALAAGISPFASGVLSHKETSFYALDKTLIPSEVSYKIYQEILGMS